MIDDLKKLRDAHTALREECEDAGCLHSSYGALLSGITAIVTFVGPEDE